MTAPAIKLVSPVQAFGIPDALEIEEDGS